MRSKKAVLLLFFIIVALLSSGCIFSGLFNRRPVIEEILNQIGKVGQEFIYQVIAYDPDNDELNYSLNEGPTGMQIESSTGLINWTPGEDQKGTFIVEVKVSDGNSFTVETFEITVEDVFLTSIEVSPANINIYVGNSNTINSITAFYDDGSNASIGLGSAIYSSNNPGIASVNTTGMVTGVSVGTAVITVTYIEGGITKTDTVSVTVEDISLTSINVSPATINIYVGNSSTINSITAFYDDGSNASIGLGSAIYSSNNPGIASVNATGGVTGISTGTAIITVSYTEGGIAKADMIGVTVSEAPKVLTSISVLPSSMIIRRGKSQTIDSITAYYNNASPANIGLSACNYQSNNTNVTVTNGVIKVSSTCGATTAIITVRYTEGGVTKSDTVNVTVPGG